jgi:DNA-binding NarL/FixJ family response regulator
MSQEDHGKGPESRNGKMRGATIAIGGGETGVFNGRGAVGMNRKGIIVAIGEKLIYDWLCRYLQKVADHRYVFIHVSTEGEFNAYIQEQGITMVFVETGFFAEAMIGNLDSLDRQCLALRLVLFTVSDFSSELARRYVCWGGDSFISLRDGENRILKRLRVIFEGKYSVPAVVQKTAETYSRIPEIAPHLTARECEVVRLVAKKKKNQEIAALLKISEKTVNNHLYAIRKKFGKWNAVGILRLAVSKGKIPVEELMG